MKRSLFAILCVLTLASCAAPSQSSVSSSSSYSKPHQEVGETYIRDLNAANKKTFATGAIGFRTTNTVASMAFQAEDEEGAIKHYQTRFDKLVYDFRIDGLNSGNLSDVHASYATAYDGNKTKCIIDGDELPSGAIPSGDPKSGIELDVTTYVDKEGVFLDLTEAAVFRTMLNVFIFPMFNDPSFTAWSRKCRFSMPENWKPYAEDALPLKPHLDEASDSLTERLLELFNADTARFYFETVEMEQSVRFATTEWSGFTKILDAALPDSWNTTSKEILDKVSEWATLENFDLSIRFDGNGLKGISYDLSATFNKVEADSPVLPEGTWTINGDVDVLSGEDAQALTLGARDKLWYQETQFPTYHAPSKE